MVTPRPKLLFFFPTFAVLIFCLSSSLYLRAETISGTVLDSSGAVITGARIEITGANLAKPLILTSDGVGKFTSAALTAGTYEVHVTRDGFEPLLRTVEVKGATSLELKLSIAQQRAEVTVQGKNPAFANSDPIYKQLREVGLGQSFHYDNVKVAIDAGTLEFQSGTITFLKPVQGVVTGAVFVGEGRFHLSPVTSLDKQELNRRIGSPEVDEEFSEMVVRFTPAQRLGFMKGMGDTTSTPPEAESAYERWKEKMRKRREDALGFTDFLLHGESMDNVDADILAAVYNPTHPPFVNIYLRGKKHKDLRFLVRARVGALPQLDSSEEVALINLDPGGMEDGIWYLAHLKQEYEQRVASSTEERRLFETHNYKIETVIGKNAHLFSTAVITLKPLVAGERVIKFELLPNLRVTRVADDKGQNLYFIQESRKDDGSFYAILPNPAELDKEYSLLVQYEGDKVLEDAGGGSYYVRARTSWYPNVNGFGEFANYDLTYKVPRKYKVISVGRLREESVEQDFAVTHWVTDIPVAVAGFNYGEYKKLELEDKLTGYKISGYYLESLPDRLSRYRALQTLAPKSMTNYALEQTRAQLQICTHFFGKLPFGEVFITEQPDFNFGQSWPNLVYLPISAYTDSTQRWLLFGNINNSFTGFVQEVTPHEVAHQWWGHAVSWASYHDQWLSEGFAEFSAGLFLQQGVAGDWRKDYIDFWKRLKERALEKNNFGVAPNEAGPLWMGLRLIAPRSENAYQNVTYPKGAYVLEMLRSIMYTQQDGDKNFIAMMHDFVESHRDRPASTESFKAIAEKHLPKSADLSGNGKLDWFFNEWVYGTQVPRYHFEYKILPAGGGKVTAHMTITQSDVNERFGMLVPVFADFGNGLIRIGQIPMVGNETREIDEVLPSQPKKVALNAYRDILER